MGNVILHCGGNKTGSTALQATLMRSREALATVEIAYPDMSSLFPTKPVQHWPLALGFQTCPERYYLMKAHQYSHSQVDQLIEGARNIVRQASRAHPLTILSAEAFANLEREEMQNLWSWLNDTFSSITVIYYARPPGFKKFYSMFQQFVKSGHAPTAPETLKHRVYAQTDQAIKISTTFEHTLFRIFSEEHLVNGDVIDDFFATIGAQRPLASQPSQSRINASLSHWATALIYFLNRSSLALESLPDLRQNIMKLNRVHGNMEVVSQEIPEAWNAELVLHEHSAWCSYLKAAGEFDLEDKLQAKKPEFQRIAEQSDLLENPGIFIDWLAGCLPDKNWLRKHAPPGLFAAIEHCEIA